MDHVGLAMKKWKVKAKEWLKSEILKTNSDIALIATRLNDFNEDDIVVLLYVIYYILYIIYYILYIIYYILNIICCILYTIYYIVYII